MVLSNLSLSASYYLHTVSADPPTVNLEFINKGVGNKNETFLKSHKIEIIQTETYDSDLHEVISILPIGESKIIDVVSKGYTLDGKPFRYPKIILGE